MRQMSRAQQIFYDQSSRKYGTGQGFKSWLLDLQSDSLPIAPWRPVIFLILPFKVLSICIINFAKLFSKFHRRCYDLISKFHVGLKSLLRQGLLKSEFYGDLVYKLKKIVGTNHFPAQLIKIISQYKKMVKT